MSKIEIRHSSIVIHDYSIGDRENLERFFSIYDKAYHRYKSKVIYYDEEKRDLYLPSGMDMYYIIKNFGNDIFRKVSPDYYEAMENVKLRYRPRDDTQKQAIKFLLGKDNFFNNKRASQLCLNLGTGKGKTYVAIAVSVCLNVKTIMITSSIDWIMQWKNKILEYTNIKEDEIYVIQGSSSVAKLINGIKSNSNIKFYLCSHDTLKSIANKYGWESIRSLFQSLKVGIKIYDEAHYYFDNMCMIDYFTDVWKTFYLTATPSRSDRKEDILYKTVFKNVPKINMFDPENDPHTEYIAVLFNSHPSPMDISNCQNMYGFSQLAYCNYLVYRENYYNILNVLLTNVLKETSPEGKILIYIGTNYAIRLTYYWLIYYFRGISIGIFTSIVPKEEKQNALNCKIILSTTKSAGAALDIYGLETTIVLNEPFKSKVLAQQTFGRTRAKNTKYYDVVDVGFGAITYYYRTKMPLFREFATKCSEIHLTDYELNQMVLEINRAKEEERRIIETNPNIEKKQIVTIEKIEK